MVERKRVPVTREGLKALQDELEQLKTVKMPQITATVAEARSHGDLRENAGYHAAREDQMHVKRRIDQIELVIKSAIIIEENEPGARDTVRIGSKVIVLFHGEEETYSIVGTSIEAKPMKNIVSSESPVGKALMGRKVGESAEFASPAGKQTLKVLRIE